MNERIGKLLNRSGGEFYEGFAGSPNTIKFTEEEFKTFAELIVRECAGICDQQGRVGWNDDRKAQAKLDRDLIKEHFGVEQ